MKYAYKKIPAPVLVLVLLIFSGMIFLSLKQTAKSKEISALEANSDSIILHTQNILTNTQEIETGERGFVLTGNLDFLSPYVHAQKEVFGEIEKLKMLTREKNGENLAVDSLSLLVKGKINFSTLVVNVRKTEGMPSAIHMIADGTGNRFRENIAEMIRFIQAAAYRNLQHTKKLIEETASQVNAVLAGTLISFLILVGVFIFHEREKNKIEHRTNEQMLKSEEKFRLLTGNLNNLSMITVDENGRISQWNDAAERITGYSAESILGKPVRLLYNRNGKEPEEQFEDLETARRTGKNETERWSVRKDGSLFWAQTIYTEARSVHGRAREFSVIINDITKSRNAAEQLDLFNRHIDLSNDAIYTVDADLKILSWNVGAEKMFGYTKKEAIGKNSVVLLKTEMSEQQVHEMLNTAQTEGYWSGELKRKTKSGKELIVLGSSTATRNARGEVTGYLVVNVDITKRKALSDEVNNLAGIVEQATDVIISINLERKIIGWNKGAEKLLGFTKGEVMGKTLPELGAIHLAPEEISRRMNLLRSKGSFESEMNVYHKDGRMFYVAVTSNAFRDEQNRMISIFLVLKDITQRRKLELELKLLNEQLEQKVEERAKEVYHNEKRFRVLLENNHDMISLMDSSFRIIYRSPSTARITGWEDHDLVGMEGTALIHPDDKEYAQKTVSQIFTYPGKPIQAVFRNRHKNGNYLWIEGTVINLLNDESVRAIVFNFRDITQRKEAEEKLATSELKFRSLIENSAEGIALTDEKFNALYRSPAAKRIIGFVSEESVLSRVHADYLPYLKAITSNCLVKPGIPLPFEAIFLHADNYYFWLEGTVTNQLHINGVNAIVFNYRDITQRKLAEEKLVSSEETYRELIERISDGFMSMDEDWKITYINSFAENLLQKPAGHLIGKKLNEEFPEAVNRPIFNAYRDAMRTGEQKSMEEYSIVLDKWLSVNIFPSSTGVSVFFKDITEQRRIEAEAKKNDEKYRTLIQRMTDAFFMLDINWQFTYVNQQAGNLFHREPADLLGKNIWREFSDPSGIATKTIYEEALRTQRYQENIDYYAPLDFWHECHIYPSEEGLSVFMRDITARKKAEAQLIKSFVEKQNLAERMSSILNTLPANIVLLDQAGKIIEVNESWKKFAVENNYQGNSFYIGENYLDISRASQGEDAETGKIVAEEISRLLNGEREEFVLEYPCHSPNVKRWFRMVVTPLQESNFRGAVVMHIDISELHILEEERMNSKIEEQRRITEAMLQAQEKERNAIAQDLHDNVNQILAGTKLLLSFAQTEPAQSEYVIATCIKNLQEAIDENRKIAHELITPDFHSARIVDQLHDLTDSMLAKSGIQVKLETELFDADLLNEKQQLTVYRIAQEQCANILKHAKAKQVTLSLVTGGKLFVMVITDDGAGVDAAAKAKGIGLRNIRNRLDLFHGKMEVISSPGNGFTMEIEMPLNPQQEKDDFADRVN